MAGNEALAALLREGGAPELVENNDPGAISLIDAAARRDRTKAIEIRGAIRIKVYESEEGIEIELADNGRGIPESIVADIFEISLTRKGDRVGMRLGLPMSKRSLEEMGGRLSLESIEGQGTTVRMIVPTGTRT